MFDELTRSLTNDFLFALTQRSINRVSVTDDSLKTGTNFRSQQNKEQNKDDESRRTQFKVTVLHSTPTQGKKVSATTIRIMGKKSRRPPGRKHKRSKLEELLSTLDLPFPLNGPDAPEDPRDHRQLADFCLKNFLHFRKDKDNEMRFVLFHPYTSLILLEEGICKSRDVRVLKKLAKDKTDLAYFRVEACRILAFAYYRRIHDVEGTTFHFKKVVNVCENATEDEKRRQLPSGMSVADHLSQRQHQATEEIDKNCNERTLPRIGSDGKIVGNVPFSAGNMCDNCQKTKAELRVERFLCCGRCKLEYYCSPECQRAAWDNGHKKLCRAKGDFRPGDQVLDVRDGEQIQLVEHVEAEDAWVVANLRGTDQHSVPTKKLLRVRPVLWRQYKRLAKSKLLEQALEQGFEETHNEQAQAEQDFARQQAE